MEKGRPGGGEALDEPERVAGPHGDTAEIAPLEPDGLIAEDVHGRNDRYSPPFRLPFHRVNMLT